MKKLFLALTMAAMAVLPLQADEGMWLPFLAGKINIDQMRALGLQLSAAEIYSLNQSSLKDAIVQFGGGCTAEVVSPNGLLFTNHHCGYGQIQSHSSVQHDYLTDGFWAGSYEEELPCPGLTVKFLVRMEDVSAAVNSALTPDMDAMERYRAEAAVFDSLIEANSEEGKYLVHVKSYYQGNEYYMLVYREYKDIRLVGTPPESIGKFGADADNWMWPRHTGDFSVFRVYADSLNQPAEYSPTNVPYKPLHYLPVNIAGIEQNDYAMVLGYPGSTDRFLPSWGVKEVIEYTAPATVKTRRAKLDVLDNYMAQDPAVRIQYASIYAGIANYWKNYMGQEIQLKKNRVVEKKQAIEAQFAEWAADKDEYKNVLAELEEGYAASSPVSGKYYSYLRECVLGGSQIFSTARMFKSLENALADKTEGNAERLVAALASLQSKVSGIYKDFDPRVNTDITARMLQLYHNDLPEEWQPASFRAMIAKNKYNFDAAAAKIMAGTVFASEEKLNAFLANPSLKKLQQDPCYKLVWELIGKYNEVVGSPEMTRARNLLDKNRRLFTKGVREMNPGTAYAPDANLTMRLTYGSVQDYAPADAVHYDYICTLEGVMQKEEPGNPDFTVPAKLKELYNAKDYGPYGDSTLVVCFLTTNDITGGNSGSPVINAKGELIGLAFDGNWEAMSGDIYYEPNLQRTICVDARYVLFVMDKYAGAKNLINELTIINQRPTVAPEAVQAAADEEI